VVTSIHTIIDRPTTDGFKAWAKKELDNALAILRTPDQPEYATRYAMAVVEANK
jgi:hypothetical protein